MRHDRQSPLIVHISGDFPDVINAEKTPVIRTLLELTSDRFEHRAFSLNRRTPGPAKAIGLALARAPGQFVSSQAFNHGTAVEYFAPPKGLFHETMLKRLADWLADDIARTGRTPDLIVGHKLSIEGIVAERAASLLGTRYAISIQGDSDTKILAARPDLTGTYRRIFHGAQVVFPFAPWSLHALERKLGKRAGPSIMLPCPTDIDEPRPPQKGDGRLVSVFHLKNHKRKNLAGICAASAILADRQRTAPVAVIGGGSDSDVERCKRLTRNAPNVVLSGKMDRDALRGYLPKASGFVMPSHRESFGLVFIEALFCGLPVIYPQGAAVDGYFDNLPFAIKVDAENPTAIANAMQHLLDNEMELKQALFDWQRSPDARRFTRHSIADHFASGLVQAIA